MSDVSIYDELLDGEKIIMPKQASAFNNDHFVAAEFLKLKEKFNIKSAIELGSAVMGTSKFLGENFDKVLTVEISEEFRKIGLKRIAGMKNITSFLGDSITMLPTMLSMCDNRTIVFIDSHWYDHLPLLDELKLIKASGLTPVIVVHDCLVPNEPNLGYDTCKDIVICYDVMKSYFDDIYGVDGYEYHYNSDAESTFVKRGVIYVYPKMNSVERLYNFRKND